MTAAKILTKTKILTNKSIPKEFLKNFQRIPNEFQNILKVGIQFPRSHLEAKNPFRLVDLFGA